MLKKIQKKPPTRRKKASLRRGAWGVQTGKDIEGEEPWKKK